jgi:hypothetical protein
MRSADGPTPQRCEERRRPIRVGEVARNHGAALLWITVALLTNCVPAYHATKVDPLIAPRRE